MQEIRMKNSIYDDSPIDSDEDLVAKMSIAAGDICLVFPPKGGEHSIYSVTLARMLVSAFLKQSL